MRARANLRIFEIFLSKKGTSLNLDLEDSKGFTPLMSAIEAKQTDVAIKLIDCGADIHKFSKNRLSYSLSIAIHKMDMQVTKYLIQKGVKILPCGITFLRGDNFVSLNGATPLFLALAFKASKEIIDCLIAAGDDPHAILNCENVDFSGINAIYWAVWGNQPREVLEYLLKDLRLNPNMQSKSKKQFPLYMAIYRSYDTFKLLLQYGANPHIKDESGETVLKNCCSGFAMNAPKMIALLLHEGLDPNEKIGYKKRDTCFSEFIKSAFKEESFKDHRHELTELFLSKGGKINLEMENTIRESYLYKSNPKFKRLIDENTKMCTIM